MNRERSWSSRATQRSSPALWSCSGPIWLSARPGVIPSSSREWSESGRTKWALNERKPCFMRRFSVIYCLFTAFLSYKEQNPDLWIVWGNSTGGFLVLLPWHGCGSPNVPTQVGSNLIVWNKICSFFLGCFFGLIAVLYL